MLFVDKPQVNRNLVPASRASMTGARPQSEIERQIKPSFQGYKSWHPEKY
jgi:hypothetical protein